MKGIILAGGSGTRLYPITRGVVKQLLPIYDKPMIYYPLSVLMMADIKEFLIISTPQDISRFTDLFGDGSDLGISIEYISQEKPEGIAQAFLIGEKFIGSDDVALVLGDNIFYGAGLPLLLQNAKKVVEDERKATIFGYEVEDPKRYGVAEFNDANEVVSLVEKPTEPQSNCAITGLYFYTNEVVSVAKTLQKSERGEYEITDIHQKFLEQKKLHLSFMDKSYTWMDMGTHESLQEASNFVALSEKKHGMKIGCVEEIAYEKEWISAEQVKTLAVPLAKNKYGKYLLRLITD